MEKGVAVAVVIVKKNIFRDAEWKCREILKERGRRRVTKMKFELNYLREKNDKILGQFLG